MHSVWDIPLEAISDSVQNVVVLTYITYFAVKQYSDFWQLLSLFYYSLI